jgi:L-malate glycosyltransferase
VGPPRRVLLVIDSLDGGGAERYVVDLAIALRSRGWDVEVACSAAGVRAGQLRASDVPVNVLAGSLVKRRLSLRYVRALRRLLAQGRYDVVHAHLYASGAAAAAAVPRHTPLILTEHTEGPWRSWRARAVSRWSYRRACRIVAVSAAIRNVLVDVYHVPPARIEVLPAVPALPVRPRATRLGGEQSAVVGFAGRLIREKGVDVFLRAASLVAGVVPEARFVVIGAGRLRGELEALAGDLGLLEERVRFLGFRDDAADLIAALDILAVPSRSDGTPLVVGEAMIAGVPVVVSRVGGLPDQVTHRQTGLVVDPEDPEGLAAALVSLLLAPDEARQLGEAGRAHAARFPHAAFVDRMEELYSQAHQPAAAPAHGRASSLSARPRPASAAAAEAGDTGAHNNLGLPAAVPDPPDRAEARTLANPGRPKPGTLTHPSCQSSSKMIEWPGQLVRVASAFRDC